MFSEYFFFQAEDGIRDHCVTGVQTCALPIYLRVRLAPWRQRGKRGLVQRAPGACRQSRSEERRVGKECRTRKWAYYKKITTISANPTVICFNSTRKSGI